MTTLGKTMTEKLLEILDQDTVINYVVNKYSEEVIDELRDDIHDMYVDEANSWINDRD